MSKETKRIKKGTAEHPVAGQHWRELFRTKKELIFGVIVPCIIIAICLLMMKDLMSYRGTKLIEMLRKSPAFYVFLYCCILATLTSCFLLATRIEKFINPKAEKEPTINPNRQQEVIDQVKEYEANLNEGLKQMLIQSYAEFLTAEQISFMMRTFMTIRNRKSCSIDMPNKAVSEMKVIRSKARPSQIISKNELYVLGYIMIPYLMVNRRDMAMILKSLFPGVFANSEEESIKTMLSRVKFEESYICTACRRREHFKKESNMDIHDIDAFLLSFI